MFSFLSFLEQKNLQESCSYNALLQKQEAHTINYNNLLSKKNYLSVQRHHVELYKYWFANEVHWIEKNVSLHANLIRRKKKIEKCVLHMWMQKFEYTRTVLLKSKW